MISRNRNKYHDVSTAFYTASGILLECCIVTKVISCAMREFHIFDLAAEI